jgi:hypothetical protein
MMDIGGMIWVLHLSKGDWHDILLFSTEEKAKSALLKYVMSKEDTEHCDEYEDTIAFYFADHPDEGWGISAIWVDDPDL